MASSLEYVEFVLEQIDSSWNLRYRKMFGEYMIYVNDKPVLMVCDDTVYVKIKDETTEILKDSDKGYPYKGSKEHYILDIEDRELVLKVIEVLERITEIPKKKSKK